MTSLSQAKLVSNMTTTDTIGEGDKMPEFYNVDVSYGSFHNAKSKILAFEFKYYRKFLGYDR